MGAHCRFRQKFTPRKNYYGPDICQDRRVFFAILTPRNNYRIRRPSGCWLAGALKQIVEHIVEKLGRVVFECRQRVVDERT